MRDRHLKFHEDRDNLRTTTAAVPGANILDVIDKFLAQYVIYPNEHMRHAHVLWIVHTHFMDLWDSTPRIHFKSPEPGSGKTRALEVSEHIVHRGFIALNIDSRFLNSQARGQARKSANPIGGRGGHDLWPKSSGTRGHSWDHQRRAPQKRQVLQVHPARQPVGG